MQKGRDLVGLPIIVFSSGEQIGIIRDIIFDPFKNKILGFVTEEKGWFRGAKVVPFKKVYQFEDDVVIVSSSDVELKTADIPEIEKLSDEEISVIGMDIVTESGNQLGVIEDIIVDIESGYIEGYEISGGIIKDILGGRICLPLLDSLSIEKDKIIIPDWLEKEIDKENGGLKAVLSELKQDGGERIKEIDYNPNLIVQELKKHSDKVKRKNNKNKVSKAGTSFDQPKEKEFLVNKSIEFGETNRDEEKLVAYKNNKLKKGV